MSEGYQPPKHSGHHPYPGLGAGGPGMREELLGQFLKEQEQRCRRQDGELNNTICALTETLKRIQEEIREIRGQIDALESAARAEARIQEAVKEFKKRAAEALKSRDKTGARNAYAALHYEAETYSNAASYLRSLLGGL